MSYKVRENPLQLRLIESKPPEAVHPALACPEAWAHIKALAAFGAEFGDEDETSGVFDRAEVGPC